MAHSRKKSLSEDELARRIGRRIREFREARGWGQVDLEAALDEKIKRSSISDFETGRRMPSLRTLHSIAGVFKIDVAAFFLWPNDSVQHRASSLALARADKDLSPVLKLLEP